MSVMSANNSAKRPMGHADGVEGPAKRITRAATTASPAAASASAPEDLLNKGKIIAMYNHKGGVGKTSMTASLGWALADSGKKVLLVDADPQCNLTGFLVDPGFEFLLEHYDGDERIDDPMHAFYHQESTRRCNLAAACSPLLGSAQQQQHFGLNERVQTQLCTDVFQVCKRNQFVQNEEWRTKLPDVPEKLFLLGGHPDTHNFELKISTAIGSREAVSAADNIVGCFAGLLRQIQRAQGEEPFDFIILDLSPSRSIVNELLVTLANYLIVPCSPDFYSNLAIAHLGEFLPRWCQSSIARASRDDAHQDFKLPPRMPIVLGLTFSMYRLAASSKKTPETADFRPVKAAWKWFQHVQSNFTIKVAPKLEKYCLVSGLVSRGEEDNVELASVPFLNSAANLANLIHVPGYALTGAHASMAGAAQTVISTRAMAAARRAIERLKCRLLASNVVADEDDIRDRQNDLITMMQKYPDETVKEYIRKSPGDRKKFICVLEEIRKTAGN
ncbi:uncharacterized protein MONBRDRAFT_29444 [Monosiga brevicollis MX1]|uniref:AAA domain-containing protein n=1 Tax=Monosiga brevicollis TaxID=81824 RepID=A9VB43_MONBE|nr:uncharacterized protein MONBRDRAFT_29444 [Monosiga brevicollis MX1]EDQ85326.1 predicted protein [Monosiga brevicollis MX1]|eukprot:XP_001749947.1 hypothetical protein [Monosiga brevicollis MX1]